MHPNPTPTAAAAGAGNRAKTARARIPHALADVALIDGPTAAATAAMSMSQFHEMVRTGKAPAPAVKEKRFTRWRMSTVREWLIDLGGA